MSERARILSLVLLLVAAGIARADGDEAAPATTDTDTAKATEETVLDTNDLKELSGREDTEAIFLQAQVVNQSALLQQNTLINSQTGHNTLAEGALNGATGFTTVIQNSGNQVVLQNTTLISVTISP